MHLKTAFEAQWEQMISHELKVKHNKQAKVSIVGDDYFFCLMQVETVGDKYMTVSGLPEPCTHHAKSIGHLALDMMEIAEQVKVDDEPVQVWRESCALIKVFMTTYS